MKLSSESVETSWMMGPVFINYVYTRGEGRGGHLGAHQSKLYTDRLVLYNLRAEGEGQKKAPTKLIHERSLICLDCITTMSLFVIV